MNFEFQIVYSSCHSKTASKSSGSFKQDSYVFTLDHNNLMIFFFIMIMIMIMIKFRIMVMIVMSLVEPSPTEPVLKALNKEFKKFHELLIYPIVLFHFFLRKG